MVHQIKIHQFVCHINFKIHGEGGLVKERVAGESIMTSNMQIIIEHNIANTPITVKRI
jgi:hypothetical protein